MRFDPSASLEVVLQALRREAQEAYGPERLEALAASLESSATAVWRLSQAPFEPTEEEPDTLAAGGPRG